MVLLTTMLVIAITMQSIQGVSMTSLTPPDLNVYEDIINSI